MAQHTYSPYPYQTAVVVDTKQYSHTNAYELKSGSIVSLPIVVEEEDAETAREWKAGRDEWLIVVCLCVVNACVALDATVVVPVLPTIARTIGADAVQAFWIGTGYLIPTAVSQLFINGLSESFGRLPLLLFSITCFTVGSIVSALANHVPQMLVGRVIQGVGGGGINCLTLVIITDIVPMKQRPNFMAFPQLTWAVGTMVGPLIGGALSSHWRWCWWLNLPFCGIGLIMAPLVVKIARKTETLPFLQALAKVDWIGASIFIAGLTSFLVGLSFGGTNYPWSSYQTLLPLTLGGAATILSLVYEAKWANHPFIELAIYKSYSSIALLCCTFLQGLLLYLGLYLWNLYFQGVRALSPLRTGISLLPIMSSIMPASALTGALIARRHSITKPALLAGWALILTGNGLVLLWSTTTPTATWAATMLVSGFAHGAVLIASFVAIQSQVPTQYMSHAAAMYTFLRELGLSCGVGIGGTVFQNRLSYWLGQAKLPTQIARDVEAFVGVLNQLTATTAAKGDEGPVVRAVRQAIAEAHRNVFEVCLGFVTVALVLVVFVRMGSNIGHGNGGDEEEKMGSGNGNGQDGGERESGEGSAGSRGGSKHGAVVVMDAFIDDETRMTTTTTSAGYASKSEFTLAEERVQDV